MISDLMKIFPYKRLRKGQKEAIQFITNVIDNERIGLLHAPTGIGKTISAIMGVMLSNNINEDDRIFFLTRTKTQLQVYVKELEKIRKKFPVNYVVMRSKRDYCLIAHKSKKIRSMPYYSFMRFCDSIRKMKKCPFFINSYEKTNPSEKLLTAKFQIEEIGASPLNIVSIAKRNKVCPYELAKFILSTSKFVIGSYNYIFSDVVRESFFASAGIDLKNAIIVVDEAHNLPDFITSTFGIYISDRLVLEGIKELARLGKEYVDLQETLQMLMREIQGIMLSEIGRPKVMNLQFLDDYANKRFIANLRDSADRYIEQGFDLFSKLTIIADFLERYRLLKDSDKFLKIAMKEYTNDNIITKVGLELIDPSYVAMDIFDSAKAVLLMSGSLYPLNFYIYSLGLHRNDRTSKLIIESPFPKDSIKILVDMSTTTKYSERSPHMLNLIAERIDTILDAFPHSVLVVFPSYELMNKIARSLKHQKNILLEDKETNIDDVLIKLNLHNKLAIFSVAGGKLMEGIDYRVSNKTLIKGVIMVGIPFPEINDILNMKMQYYQLKYGERLGRFLTITAPAIRKILQAAGRLIRSEDDKGIFIMLDKRFHKYGYWKYFPDNWKKYELFFTSKELVEKIQKWLRMIKIT